MALPSPPQDPHALKGEEIAGPGRRYYADPTIDALMDAVTELAAELWAVKDRNFVLERVLADQDLTGRIERWIPTAEDVAARAAARAAFTDRVFNGFLRMRGQAASQEQAP
jgi:hypothetical protein